MNLANHEPNIWAGTVDVDGFCRPEEVRINEVIGYWLVRVLSATEYHSDADYNSRRVGVVGVIVVVVHTYKNGLTFERLYRFASYLEGS